MVARGGGVFLVSEVPLYVDPTGGPLSLRLHKSALCSQQAAREQHTPLHSVQGYLAHKKPRPPLGLGPP